MSNVTEDGKNVLIYSNITLDFFKLTFDKLWIKWYPIVILEFFKQLPFLATRTCGRQRVFILQNITTCGAAD